MIDFDHIWSQCPGRSNRRWAVLGQLAMRNLEPVRSYLNGLYPTNIVSRQPRRQMTADDLTRDQWCELLIRTGVAQEQIPSILRQLGFNPPR